MPHPRGFLEEQLALRASLGRSAAMMENADDASAEDLAELRRTIADVDARIARLRARLAQPERAAGIAPRGPVFADKQTA